VAHHQHNERKVGALTKRRARYNEEPQTKVGSEGV
jgi:hypothetical protein